MKLVYPDYYPLFRCTAERCRHTCCKGWEIDIDEETADFYRSVPDAMGERIREQIEWSEPTHFRLTESERCPFLNDRNLCDLILTLGEEHLCQICRDHPRFRSFFSDRTEIGVGLCCEVAGALILGKRESVRFLTEGEERLTEQEMSFLKVREALISVLQDRSLPMEQRLDELQRLCGLKLPNRSPKEWAGLFRTLERLDPAWENCLDTLETSDGSLPEDARWEIMLEQLGVYFIYRHLTGALEDGDLGGRAAFAVLSCRIIGMLCAAREKQTGRLTVEDVAELARAYSSEIEYDEDNMICLLDDLDDHCIYSM